MIIDFEHKMVNSVNVDDIAISRIYHFLKAFALDTLMLECHQLSIEKEENIIDKAKYNKTNWKNQSYKKTNPIQIYDFGFYTEKNNLFDNMSPFLIKHKKYTKNIQGKVYYSDGKILRIIVKCFASSNTMLNFINFNQESHQMIARYYRLATISLKNIDFRKVEIRGFIECSFKFKNKKCLLEYVANDIRFAELAHNVSIYKGSSTMLSDLLRVAVGPRDGLYEGFMIRFDNNKFKSLTSMQLKKMQLSFPHFPALHDLIRCNSFDDYIMVLEMEQI